MNLINWLLAYPELLLLGGNCAVLLIDVLFAGPTHRLTFWLTQALIGTFGLLHARALFAVRPRFWEATFGMQGLMVSDPLSHLLIVCAAIAVMATLAYAQNYIVERQLRKGEFYTLVLFSLLGMAVMIGANHFLMLYLGLEVMSLALYALAALRRDHTVSTEAGMKYFVLGALASGFLLYGLSMLYGATGGLFIPHVFAVIASGTVNPLVLTFASVFVMAGIAFKFGLAPFHMWVPDVYQGAPTPVTLLIAGASKLAAFGLAVRLLVDGMMGLAAQWQDMVIVVAVVSMLIGNVAAIAQTNLKRMLAYSAIGQLGFMLLGFAPSVVFPGTPDANAYSAGNGYSSALFYILVYVLTTVGTFGAMMALSRPGYESEEIADLAGLAKRAPWQAAVMAVLMFSLAGIPPMVGFYAKFAILQALVSTNQPSYVAVAVIAVVLSLVAAFYYLRVVKTMYFDAPAQRPEPQASSGVQALLAVNGAAVLLLGLWPTGLMTLCIRVIEVLLAA